MGGPWERYKKSATPSDGPWSKYQTPASDESQEDETGGAPQAALEHYGNAATLGYLPHLQALAEQAMPNPSAQSDADLERQGFKIQQSKPGYLKSRDENLKRLELERQEHPIASGVGTLAGIGAGALIPVGAAAKGASLGQKVVQGAKAGALMGAIANPGDVEGEVDPTQLDSRLKNAGVGLAVGGAIPVVAQGTSGLSNKVSNFLRDKAALKATRALGMPGQKLAEKMAANGQDVELGRDLLDSGAIPVLGTPKSISARVEALKEKTGAQIGELLDRGGNAKLIDSQKLGLQILDSPELQAMRKTPGMESTVAAIEKQVETLASNGELSLKETQALRQGIDRSINFNKAAPEMRGAQEGLYKQRTALRDAMNEAVNSLSPGDQKDALLVANRRYGSLSTAGDILEKEIGRNQSNRAISGTDTMAGVAGLLKGGPAYAALATAANKFGRTFGNSIQARAYDALAKKGQIPKPILDAVEKGSVSIGNAIRMLNQPELEHAVAMASAEAPKGEDRWAQSGIDKLGIKDPASAQRLLQSKEGKRLLIQASDLTPGSRAMQRIQEQIDMLEKGIKNDSLSSNPSEVSRLQRKPSRGR